MPPYLLDRRYAYGGLDERLRVQFLQRLVEQPGVPHRALRVVEKSRERTSTPAAVSPISPIHHAARSEPQTLSTASKAKDGAMDAVDQQALTGAAQPERRDPEEKDPYSSK